MGEALNVLSLNVNFAFQKCISRRVSRASILTQVCHYQMDILYNLPTKIQLLTKSVPLKVYNEGICSFKARSSAIHFL